MMFKEGTKLYAYEIRRIAGNDILYVNYLGAPFVPSIADSPAVMNHVIDLLLGHPNASRIVFVQQRNYDYDFSQISLLSEIAQLYNHLIKQLRILSPEKLSLPKCQQCLPLRYNSLNSFLVMLKQDPIMAYQYLKTLLRGERINLEKIRVQCKSCQINFIRLLEKILVLMENTKLIKQAEPFLISYVSGDRSLYTQFFRPSIIPNFAFTKLVASIPADAEIFDQYQIGKGYDKSLVTILKKPNETKYFYHLMPPEYSLGEEHQLLLNLARNVMIEHQPRTEDYIDTERTRNVFFNIARDLIQDLANNKNIPIDYDKLNQLARILVRHTIGFGLIEILLQDENLQDIDLNAPITLNPIFVRHNEFDECATNIIPSKEDGDSWASKFRMLSGRPLDEANPILDTNLVLEKIRARVSIVQQPISPHGLAYALRRHREKPWTLPLFINNKMLDSFTAGLLSFMVDGARTLLIGGTRSSGKTSLLGALMLEILPKLRIITIEDTLELPVDALRKLNYDILSMKVRSALFKATEEVSAEEGIRASLRLGDSCLIIGEVRSSEAKSLWEAMRVGALANVVAGTIHGASPYAVFDRVVNDLGVPITSFKATDLVLIANPIKSADGLHSFKRVVQLTEIRKHWTKDPLEEKGFVDLLKYDVKEDKLIASPDLINGESEIIKQIAGTVKGWAGDWDAVYDNIMLRAKIKQEIVNIAKKSKKPELLEADFVSLANNVFHEISDEVREEIGLPLSEKVFPKFQDWLKKQAKKGK